MLWTLGREEGEALDDTRLPKVVFFLQYLGRWFQQEAHPSLANRSGKCWSHFYSRKNEDDAYELEVTTDYVSTL